MYSTEQRGWHLNLPTEQTYAEWCAVRQLPPCIQKYLSEGVHDTDFAPDLRKQVMLELLVLIGPIFEQAPQSSTIYKQAEAINRERFFPPLTATEMIEVQDVIESEERSFMPSCDTLLRCYCNRKLCESREYGILKYQMS